LKRHELDPISLLFGLFFAAIALIFLFGEIDMDRLDEPWLWSLPVLLVGLVFASVGFRNVRMERAAVPAIEEPPTMERNDTEELELEEGGPDDQEAS
jgi:hypothetical protein